MRNLMKALRPGMVCAAAAMLVCAGAAQAQQISDNVVRIGVMSDMSGPYADTAGMGSVEAVKMAVEDFGGTVLGKKIDVVWADHQNKADIGATRAREWFDRDGVDMIVDLNNTAVSIAVYSLAKERGKVLINTAAGSDVLTGEYCIPTATHYTYDTYAFASGTVNGLLEQGKKDWFILAVNNATGKTSTETMTKIIERNGGKVVGKVFYPLGASDFSSYILQAQSSGASVISFWGAGSDTVNAVKSAHQFGLTPKQTLVSQLMFISDVRSLGLELAQGMMFATAFYWDRTPESRAWAQRYYSRTKRMPSMIQAGNYSAITQYLKAVESVKTDDGVTVAKQLKQMKLNDMFVQNGTIREDGRMVHDMYLAQIKSPQESKGEWDYYKIISTIPGDKAFRPLSESPCSLAHK